MKSRAGTFAAALSLVILLPFCGGGIDRHPIEDLSSDEVTYQTADGVQIVAGWYLPNETNPPVAILLHEQDGTHGQWNELIPVLVDHGYAVLAPDIRGFGKSNTIIRDGKEEPYQFASPLDALLDVAAALEWLKGRNDVNVNQIGVIGARLGANLAYASTAVFPADVKAAVAVTPSPYATDDPLIGSIRDYAAHDVCIMAGSEKGWLDAVTLGIRIQYPGGPCGHRYIDHPELDGVTLMSIDGPIKDILDWFKERLPNPLPTAPLG